MHLFSLFAVFRTRVGIRAETQKDFVVYFFAALIKHEICLKCEKSIVSVSYFLVFFAKTFVKREIQKVYSRFKESTKTKNCSNKSCWELNFVQKTHWVHMAISPRSGAIWLERLICLNILYWNRKVDPLGGWMLSKLSMISKNCSNKSRWKLFPTKKSVGAHVYPPPPGVVAGRSKDCHLWNIIMH